MADVPARQWLFVHEAMRDRVALLEDAQLVEYYEESTIAPALSGSIFWTIVRDVVPAIAAAFVDAGLPEKFFLQPGPESAPLHVGDRLAVQVTRESSVGKAPRASLELDLPGHFLALLLDSDYVGVSRKITEVEERERLQALLTEQLQKAGAPWPDLKLGAIARTLAQEASAEDLRGEVEFLVERGAELMNQIACLRQTKSAPQLLYAAPSLPERMVRDRVHSDDAVLTQGLDLRANGLRPPLQRPVLPPFAARSDAAATQLSRNLFERFYVEELLQEAQLRTVTLPQGGSIVIDRCEALTAIDVNSGASTQAHTLEETAYHTNLEAARAAARQIRLRNIGGIVIVDFIEMRSAAHHEKLMWLFDDELARDPARIHLLPLDEFGLAKLTRKKQ